MFRIWEEFPGKNDLLVPDKSSKFDMNIEVFGSRNRLRLSDPYFCGGLYLKMTGDISVEIGENCTFHRQSINLLAPGSLTIGPWCSFNGTSMINIHESATIKIGSRCLFANGVTISASHVHKIIDAATGERLNPPGDITIEDHVWLSPDVSVWGGAYLSKDTVVGLGTYISKRFPESCVIAGSPAKVIRTGTTWEF